MEPYDDSLDVFLAEGRRAVWPRLLFASDLGEIFQIKPRSAAKALGQGRYGPVIRIGHRHAVLRDDLVETLQRMRAERSSAPSPRGGPGARVPGPGMRDDISK